ncbi:unnamed protein product [Brugia timori]|uniref:Uncharacterized protein n=1 Tax=Brugia timori TaxID=42155 RepID=A0A0R3QIY8_9BILA|nr:unnamed protein product [Brugia timori]
MWYFEKRGISIIYQIGKHPKYYQFFCYFFLQNTNSKSDKYKYYKIYLI